MEAIDSILTSIKKKLGITEEYEYFDPDIIVDINTAFSILTQLGVGPSDGFAITGVDEVWSDYNSDLRLSIVQDYVYLRTKLLFDSTSLSSAVIESIKQQLSEFEWRIQVIAEPSDS